MKKRFKFFSLLFSLTSLVSCSSPSYLSAVIKNPEKVKHLTSVSQYYSDAKYLDFKNKITGFSSRFSSFFASSQIKENKNNFSCSPISAFFALGLAVTSSSGDTRKEILDVFNVEYDTFKTYYNVYFDELLIDSTIGSDNKKTLLSLSNSIWFDKEYKIVDSGLEELKNDNYCYSFQTEFKNNNRKANELVRAFIKDKTNGLIDRDFNFSTSTILLLINTIYLADTWNTEGTDLIYSENTSDEYKFTNSSGNKSSKKLLQSPYYSGKQITSETYSAFFACTNKFNIYFMTPLGDNSIQDIFTSENILQVIDDSKYIHIDSEKNEEYYTRAIFPEFEVETQSDLQDILRDNFNIKIMFSTACDFSKVVSTPAEVNRVIHDTKLIVNKKGVEGGGASIIEVVNTMPAPRETKKVYSDFLVNKEFSFILTSNDNILFSGIIKDID